jgi:MFS family permease
MDRRWVIVGTTLLAACAGVALYLFGGGNQTLTFVLVAIFGTVTLPLYGLSVAHANDRLPREMFVEASATLLMINAVASMFGPVIAAVVTARAGTSSLFLYTAAIHVSICVFALARLMAKGEPPGHLREPYEAMPPQSSPTVLELDPRSPEHEKRPDVA